MSEQRTKNKQFSILEEEGDDQYYLAVEAGVINNRVMIRYNFSSLSSWIDSIDRALSTIELFLR